MKSSSPVWLTGLRGFALPALVVLSGGGQGCASTGATSGAIESERSNAISVDIERSSKGVREDRAHAAVRAAVARVRAAGGRFGTAFLVSRDGHFLTAAHVVPDGALVEVRFAGGGPPLSAQVIDREVGQDVALLRLQEPVRAAGREPLRLWSRSGLRDGHVLYTYGFPAGQRDVVRQAGTVGSAAPHHPLWSGAATGGYSGAPVCLAGADVVVGLTLGQEREGHTELRSVEVLVAFLDRHHVPFARVPYAIEPQSGGRELGACRVPVLNLQRRLGDFVGREGEVTRIVGILQAGGRVSISGLGGSGKTALANEALWRMSEAGQTPAGVIWVNFGARDLGFIVSDLARQACRGDLIMDIGGDPLGVLSSLGQDLKDRDTLVVLDDVRTDVSHYDAVEVLCALSDVRYVQTGRAAISLSCAHEVTPFRLAGLAPEACQSLFARRAGLAQDTAGLGSVCALLSHHPLAVDIAARRYRELPSRPISLFVDELARDGIRGLSVGQGHGQDLRQNFAASIELLSPGAARLYRAVGVFPEASRYTGAALEAVAGYDSSTVFRNDRGALLRLGLLEWDEEAQRHFQHDLVHQDAAERLRAETEEAAMLERYLEYYESIAVQVSALGEQMWEKELTEDRVHLHAAMRMLVAASQAQPRNWERARQLVRWGKHLGAYFWKRQVSDAEPWMQASYDAALRLGDARSQAVLALELGNLLDEFGRARDALAWNRRAYAAATVAKDRALQLIALDHQGFNLTDLGDVEKAIAYHNRALRIARELGDRRRERSALGNLGLAYDAKSQWQQAAEYFEQALVISREFGERRAMGSALGNLGMVYAKLGNVKKAIAYHEQAVVISRELGDRHGEALDLGNMGLAYAESGAVEQAIGYYEQALAISRKVGDRRNEAAQLGNLGNAYVKLGDRARAIDYWRSSMAIFEELESPHAATLRDLIDAAESGK